MTSLGGALLFLKKVTTIDVIFFLWVGRGDGMLVSSIKVKDLFWTLTFEKNYFGHILKCTADLQPVTCRGGGGYGPGHPR